MNVTIPSVTIPSPILSRSTVELLLERVVIVTPEAHKAYGFANAIPGVRVLTIASQGARALRKIGAQVEEVELSASIKTSHALVTSERGSEVLKSWTPAEVVVFRPDTRTERALAANGCSMLSAPPSPARRLENKRAFRQLCRKNSLPIVDCTEMDWPKAGAPFPDIEGMSWPRVVQTARGFGGKRTWLWEQERPPRLPPKLLGKQVLVSPLVGGPTWTANGVVFPQTIVTGPPMRQISGDPRLSKNRFASVGIAITPPGSEIIRDELTDLTTRVGELARDQGFLGFFGVDAVGLPGGLRLIEMNARLTASLTVTTLNDISNERVPLTVLHALACMGLESIPSPDRSHPETTGGHLILRPPSSGSRKLPDPGTYQYRADRFTRVSDEPGWPPPQSFTFWPAGPDQGGPEGDWCRLLFSDQMLGDQGQFTPELEVIVSSLLNDELC